MLHYPDLAIFLLRVPVGLFFALRGGQKLISSTRRGGLARTLQADHYRHVTFWSWWIPGWEFLAGAMLVLGLGTAFAAAIIGLICLMALVTDKVEEIRVKRQPKTRCDWLCSLLYESEVMMGLICTALILQ